MKSCALVVLGDEAVGAAGGLRDRKTPASGVARRAGENLDGIQLGIGGSLKWEVKHR